MMACAATVMALSLSLSPGGVQALQIPSSHHVAGRCSAAATVSPINQCLSNQYQIKPSRLNTSPLFSSPGNNLELETPNGEGGKKKSPKKWTKPFSAMKRLIVSFFTFFLTAPAKFKTYSGKLSKKGKLIISIQILALGMIFGVGIRQTTQTKAAKASRPVEVGYSTFLDLVDVNGKGHSPGKNPALKLENVVISKDRVGFKVVTDKEKHSVAVLDKKLMKEDDVSVREIPLSEKSIYAMKPLANQELIDTLREHEVPFRAASTKASNNLATMARFSVFMVYLLFLSRMYKAMGGGGAGAGGGSGAPGKLATFAPGERMVKFDDIEGIDDAKFEVMELVDTLRNPKKYEILGARAPTGLLLEGPPGTGEYLICFSCVRNYPRN